MFDPDIIVGKTLEEAQALVGEHGYHIRTMWIDGEALFGTCDYDLKRINVATRDGIIQPGFDFG